MASAFKKMLAKQEQDSDDSNPSSDSEPIAKPQDKSSDEQSDDVEEPKVVSPNNSNISEIESRKHAGSV